VTSTPLALITGANRGLGLEFARQYVREGWKVIGCCRDPAKAGELNDTGAEVVKMDVTQAADISAMAKRLAATDIDVLICNAGVSGPRASVLTPVAQADFDQVMRTNVLGPMWAGAALAGRVRKGGKIAYVSSRMGSIGDMSNPGSALYRASKAALNAVVKAASLELKPRGVTAIALHPGWVKTDMGGAGADIDVKTSIAGMRAIIAKAGPGVSGHFFDYTGKELPW
jgi:NAD(P)-dependent dehydrogenase (short-subunit alcohol dehydrogenase family)